MAEKIRTNAAKIHRTGVSSEGRVSHARLGTQVAMLVFANSVLFGIPYFLNVYLLQYFYIPNAMSKFFYNTPTYSLLYRLQDSFLGGSPTLFFDLIIPVMVFVLAVLVLGRIWCGWACPLGLTQELISRLRRALGLKYYDPSQRGADLLQRMKYVGLFMILFYSISLSLPFLGLVYFRSHPLPYFNALLPLPYEQLDPNRALWVYPEMALGLAPLNTVVPLLSLGAFMFFAVMSFAIRRFWCYICPTGAMDAPLNRYALVQLHKNADKCTHCRVCLRVCPMKIEKVYEERESGQVTSWKCVHCYRCVESCPEEDCLNVRFMNKKVLKSKSFGS
jgi:polyferredoxin